MWLLEPNGFLFYRYATFDFDIHELMDTGVPSMLVIIYNTAIDICAQLCIWLQSSQPRVHTPNIR